MVKQFLIPSSIAVILLVLGSIFFLRSHAPQKNTVSPKTPENVPRITEAPIPAPEKTGETSAMAEKPKTLPEIKKPALAGTVVCGGQTYEKFSCFKKYYEGVIAKGGVADALADIKARYSDPFIKSQCHQLMHVIGRAAANLYPTAPEAFKYGDGFCWSGYYHGAMESIVAGVPKENVAKALDTFCADISGKKTYSFDYYNCVHGLGHGVMSLLHNELPDSLKLCDNLTGSWERSSCWSGAFMENIIADEINHAAKYLKNDDPLYPCDIVDDTYKTTCYLMQTSRMLALVGGNFAKVFSLCETVGEAYIDTCYQSLGRDASGRTVSDTVSTRTTCLLGKDYRQQSNCIIGAVKDFISYFHSDTEARGLCASLPENLRDVCFSTAKSYYSVF